MVVAWELGLGERGEDGKGVQSFRCKMNKV